MGRPFLSSLRLNKAPNSSIDSLNGNFPGVRKSLAPNSFLQIRTSSIKSTVLTGSAKACL